MTRTLPALALALALVAGSAQAQDAKLHYHDLDLSSESGRAELDRRVDAMAKKICRQQQTTGTRLGTTSGSGEMNQCIADVRAEVKAKLPKQA